MANNMCAEEEESWSFTFAPYLWLAGLEGDVGTLAGLPSSEIDLSAGDCILTGLACAKQIEKKKALNAPIPMEEKTGAS